jgi:signal peptidase I
MKNRKPRWLLLLVICIVGSCTMFLMPYLFRTYAIQAFKIRSGSMAPTLLNGDCIIVDKKARNLDRLARRDIIVFEFPKDPSKKFVQRIIGLPGETIEIRDKALFINGAPIEENYTIYADPRILPAGQGIFPLDAMPRDNFGPITVPEDHLFVMGDNRDLSNDSRFWGFVAVSKVKGKVINIYWSWDKKRHQVRWNRIGKTMGSGPQN